MKKHVVTFANASQQRWQNNLGLLLRMVFPLALWGLVFIGSAHAQEGSCGCPNGGFVIGVNASSVTTLGQAQSLFGLPAGSVSNACITINGKLQITQNYTFDHCQMFMGTGSEIEVQAAKKITITNANSIVGCATMWKGISLKGGSKIDMEGSTISDAQYAVSLILQSGYRLVNNVFSANYVGFYAKGQSNTVPAILIALNGYENSFIGNIFQSSSVYKAAYPGQSPSPGTSPYAGLLNNQVKDFRMGNTNNDNTKNYFTGIRNGVVDKNGQTNTYNGMQVSTLLSVNTTDGTGVYVEKNIGKITVGYATMANLIYGVYGSQTKAIDILYNGISKATIGIRLHSPTKGALMQSNVISNIANSSSNGNGDCISIIQSSNGSASPHRILNNTLKPRRNAINLTNINGKMVITGNGITLDDLSSPYGILGNILSGPTTISSNIISKLTGTNDNGVGIALTLSKEAQITSNSIAGTAGARLLIGISAFDSPNHLYCCNNMTHTRTGTLLGGASNDTNFSNTIFGSHDIGLVLQFVQISPQTNHGNTWVGATTASFDAQYLGNPAFIPSSLFTTEPALVPNGLTKISVPSGALPGDWFKFLGTDPTCASQVNCGVAPFPLVGESPNDFNGSVLTVADLSALTPPTSTYAVDQVLNWNTQRYLYQKLVTHPALVTWSPAVTAFYNNAVSGPVGQFHAVQQGIRSLGFPPAELSASYEQLLLDIAAATSTTQLDALAQSLAAIEQQIAAWKANRIGELTTLLNAIPTPAAYQQNEKDILLLYLQTVAQDITSFTPAQQATIDAMANLCAYEGGSGVYWARMMRQYYNEGWDWQDECTPLAYRSEETANELPKVHTETTLYPNPANGQVTVSLEAPLKNGGIAAIFDLQGRLLASQQLLPGDGQATLGTEKLPNGLYTVKLTTDGRVLKALKLAVLH